MSSVPVLDRMNTPCDEDEWTEIRSPRLHRATAEDVRYSIAVARARYNRGAAVSVEIELDDQAIGGGDRELAVDISESVAQLWDQ
jgi:hypothetical protein